MKLQKGQRVRVKPLGIKGTITYINQKDYFNHHLRPIQVELDRAYDESEQTMYRTNMFEVVKLKKKTPTDKPKKKRAVKNDETETIFDFTAV